MSNHERETFHEFFESWLVEQNRFLHELIDASKQQPAEEQVLVQLIEKVVRHYEDYYRTKSSWVKEDVLGMLSPSWRSQLEEAFLWIGGWRPSTAFHLLYSKSGLQLEARLSELIRGVKTGDLGDLSSDQLVRVDELQRRIIREEKDITEKLAERQETVADTSMVELSHLVTESAESGGELMEEQVESTLVSKEEGLEKILDEADHLRLRTLKEIVGILKPMQTVHFLIAAAELHLRLHDWGKKRQAARRHHHATT